jgi:pimeloyl-ACP methyl ester carboxylesterase
LLAVAHASERIRLEAVSPIIVGGRELETLDLPGDPQRRPLMLLHEGLGSVGLWRAFPQQLNEATGRRTLAYSRFGHGRSHPPAVPRTRTFFQEEALTVLPEVLARCDAAEPILVGHSDGGSIALIHGGDRPVTGLVLIAAHAFVEELTLEAIAQARRAFTEEGLRERMARHHDDPDAAFRGWSDVWLDPAFATWELSAEAAGVSAPTLVIQGRDDPYGTLAQLDRIANAVRGPVTRLVLPGGHSPHLESPDQVLASITEFAAPLP